MAENSNIEWTDHTFNGWIGCTKVSQACDNCYAENWGKRFGVEWGAGKKRRLTSDAYWRKPLAWNAKAKKNGTRPKVFANSLSDVFDAEVSDEWRDRLFALIALTPNLDWLVLTKRPKVARDYLTHLCAAGSIDNLWLGTTVENQAMANLRIPLLLDTPAAKRFLSCEPLLGPVDLFMDGLWCDDCSYCSDGSFLEWDTGENTCPHCCDSCGKSDDVSIDLVIAGGESGKGSRPSHPDWFRGLRDQCDAAGVPFFFKQWGDWVPVTVSIGDEHGGVPDEGISTDMFQVDVDASICGEVQTHPDPLYDGPIPFLAWDGREWVYWVHIPDDFCDGRTFRGAFRVGKKVAGRLLDGREWSEMPT